MKYIALSFAFIFSIPSAAHALTCQNATTQRNYDAYIDRQFQAADKNHDGYIDKNEYRQYTGRQYNGYQQLTNSALSQAQYNQQNLNLWEQAVTAHCSSFPYCILSWGSSRLNREEFSSIIIKPGC